jgi:DNA-binding MarR family transcriptional regulator
LTASPRSAKVLSFVQSSQRDEASPTLPKLGDVLDFMRLIWALDHALHRTSKRLKTTLGVTAPQRLVLRIVGRFPNIPAGELALLLHLHPSTLTGVLKRLERSRLIARHVDAHDRRRSLLRLTAKGASLDVDSTGSVEAAVKEALDSFTAAAMKVTRGVLESVTTRLEANLEIPRSPRRAQKPKRPRRR